MVSLVHAHPNGHGVFHDGSYSAARGEDTTTDASRARGEDGVVSVPAAFSLHLDDDDSDDDSDADATTATATLPFYFSSRALGVFGETHVARRACLRVVRSRWYSAASHACIGVSLAAVLGTDPVDHVNTWQGYVDAANVFVACFFATDFAAKCVAHGFAFTPRPYLSSPWNCLDLAMLAVDVLVLFPWSRWWRWAFNVLFAARPVRVLTRVESMQRLVSALAATLPTVASVMRLGAVIFLGFAVVGCRVFGGRFHRCNDPTVTLESECVGLYAVPSPIAPGYPARGDAWTWARREWRKPRYSFDWIGAALLTLFEVASLDGWLDVLHSAMDATGVGEQPEEDTNWAACAYFVAFVAVGSFFFVRCIVGVFIDRFGYVSGAKLLTERQKVWRDARRLAQAMRPAPLAVGPPGRSRVARARRACARWIRSPTFRVAVLTVTCADVALMTTNHFRDDDAWDSAQSFGDATFVAFYLVEAAIKAAAAHPHWRYWRNRWNAFELALALGSAATAFTRQGRWRERLGRPFRFFRVFRVVRYVPSLRILCDQMILAVPSVLSIIGLMVIWVFVYAGIGTQVFPRVKRGPSLNKDANFETFPNAFLVLFQCLTGEGWRGFMHDAAVTEPDCARDPDGGEGDCGFPNGAVVYFVSYVIAMGYVFTNLFVAAVLDHVSFGAVAARAVVGPAHLRAYRRLWSRFDPNATGFIGAHRAREFLRRLEGPLGPGRFDDTRETTDESDEESDDASKEKNTARVSGTSGDGTREDETRFESDADRRRRARDDWYRAVTREMTTLRVPGKGVPFGELLETLVAARLGPAALTVDVRPRRERELRESARWGAATAIQARVRGMAARRRYGRVGGRVARRAWE